MNYNNYHNLSSTKCNDRMYDPNTDKLLNSDKIKNICSGLNPDKIYNTFFGKHFKKKYQKKPFYESSNILQTNVNPSLNSCSKKCTTNKNCKSFSYEDNTQCYLYKHSDFVPNSQSHINYKKIYKDNKFSMKKIKNPNQKLVGEHYASFVTTQDKCKDKCLNDDNCSSYNLKLNSNYCNLYSSNDKVKTSKENINLYTKKKDNSYKIPKVYKPYYEKYPRKGNIGDYFCKFSDNKCQFVRKNDGKPPSKKKIKPLKPKHEDPCLPPKCIPSEIKSQVKTYINGVPFYDCKGKDCLDQLYYVNKLGVADLTHQPNPTTQPSLYINDFKNPIVNKTYVNCPKNYKPIPYTNPSLTSEYVCQDNTYGMCQPDSMDTTEKTHLRPCGPVFSQEHQKNPAVPNRPGFKTVSRPR